MQQRRLRYHQANSYIRRSSAYISRLSAFADGSAPQQGNKIARIKGTVLGLPSAAHRFVKGGGLTRRRTVYAFAAFIFLLSALIPTVTNLLDRSRAQLSDQVVALLDTPSEKLARKITFDEASKTFHFNKEERKAPAPATTSGGDGPSAEEQAAAMAQLQSQVTGKDGGEKTLYSVDMPQRIEDGFTYYDNNLGVSFKLIPEGVSGRGVLRDNRLIYTLNESGYKAIFTAKANGIKEDIILPKQPAEPTLAFRYRLDLLKSLEAKLLPSGELGIYSADPSLYGNISFGSDEDRTRVMNARENGVKNYLVFTVPAPVIKESGNQQNANAKFLLSDDKQFLTIYATDLDKASYPLSIDPTVVVTSNDDFGRGNNEQNASVDGGDLQAASPTGATLGAFTTTTAMNNSRGIVSSLSYNGYLYAIGDWGEAERGSYEYAQIQPDGSVGSWTKLPFAPFTTQVHGYSVVIYNGYVYVVGGNYNRSTMYAKVNSDGSFDSSWTTSPHLYGTLNLRYSKAVAHNGYLYVSGGVGATSSSITLPCPLGEYTTVSSSDIWRAKINADGSISAWTDAGGNLSTGRGGHGIAIYNNYVYVAGGFNYNNAGCLSDQTFQSNIEVANIDKNGIIGSFSSPVSLGFSTWSHTKITIYGGYIYIGTTGTLYYSRIKTDGTLFAPRVASDSLSHASAAGIVAYKGRIYRYGGEVGGTQTNTVQYATINSPGHTSSHNNGTNVSQRMGAATVVYQGYIYLIGGYNGTSYLNEVTRAQITAGGSVGTWSSSGITPLPTAKAFSVAVVFAGRLYVSGGHNGTTPTNDANWLSLSNPSGSWTTAGSPGTARYKHAAVVAGNFMYIFGGQDNGGSIVNTVRRGVLNPNNGSLGGWNNVTSFSGARRGLAAAALGNRIYIAGGYNGTTLLSDVQYIDMVNINTGALDTSWTTASYGLSTARSGHSLEAFNGCLYAIGGVYDVSGETSTGSSVATASVEMSCVDNNMAPTAWQAAANTGIARAYSAAGFLDGYMIVAGGGVSGALGATPISGNNVTSAVVNHGGSGDVGAWATSANSFSTARVEHAAVAYNGYMYISGGRIGSSTYFSDVQKAPINTDGTLGAWTIETSLVGAGGVVYGHGMVAYNGRIYVVGGNWSANNRLVYSNSIDSSTGTLGATWTAEPLLNTARYGHGIALYNGRIYVVSGLSNGSSWLYTNTIEYSQINADGSLSAWINNSTPYYGTRTGLVLGVANGYMYGMGGRNGVSTGNTFNDFMYAKINSDGSVGTWNQLLNFWSSVSYTNFVTYNGNLYLPTDGVVYKATVLPDGLLTYWEPLVSTTTTLNNAVSIVNKGMLYMVGGNNSGGAHTATVYTALDTYVLDSSYSKLIDFGVVRQLSSINYTGLLEDGKGNIWYATASTNGILGSLKQGAEITPPGASCVLPVGTRYIWIKVNIDNSFDYSSLPAGTGSLKAKVQDITIANETDRRSPIEYRMLHGKWFDAGQLQPYDTCN